ncbi:hypothetical protein JI721_02820 [Alicyclobacillus cycloheptanicus]|uniref:Uncharacterized protein n=1 Tax=Alicyclobacillus cycloheptanicus TaxID=1457 RepID=A0ABT9XKT1_9BACL|nr:hypothetical protein [Alicyclobacillus cycloheptanicus]MDQ0190913.1 hypothetical protein [Alicyclobacillus cycloheptanicus]WDM01797.1 hypothetical protein JI721_02820 [Alicyclobacillus cycloheptanicus]
MDPLDWTHQWEDFEMFMYVDGTAGEDAGIHMQVSRRTRGEGAEEWEILYDRTIAPLDTTDIAEAPGTEAWEERILRRHLQAHPELVDEEKAYVASFLQNEAK